MSSIRLLGFQASSRYVFNAFDFLGDSDGSSFLSFGHFYHGGQGNHAFVGLNLDVRAWDAFFGQQVGFDFGGDPGIKVSSLTS